MTTTKTTTMTNALSYVSRKIEEQYDLHSGMAEHYHEMEQMSASESAKRRWRHLERLSLKLKDDFGDMFVDFKTTGSLRRLAARVHEAKEERRSIIKWLAGRPQESPEHTNRARNEIEHFTDFLAETLSGIRHYYPGTEAASEAAYVKATADWK